MTEQELHELRMRHIYVVATIKKLNSEEVDLRMKIAEAESVHKAAHSEPEAGTESDVC